MLRSRFPTAHHFTLSIFGCQYHAESPDASKLDLMSKFDSLVTNAAIHVDHLEQDDIPSKIWMTYWASPQTFKAWWESPTTASLWSSLPDNAGFWRETVSLPATRAMYESNRQEPSGFGHCGEPIPLTSKTGYWGAYRSRMTPDSPEDTFSSSLPELSEPRSSSDNIRLGRVGMTRFPDNLCFVIEGQDFSTMKGKDLDYWNENFDSLTKTWITNVVKAGPQKGLVSARACHDFSGEKMLGPASHTVNGGSNGNTGISHNGIFPGLDYKQQTQLFFWLDLSKMEHIGRWDKGHVKLRRGFMEAYGPGGAAEGGSPTLEVDLGILKGYEIDAEYVGCYDNTGFLAYDRHPQFASETVATSKLPAFFDNPVVSNPIEW